MYIFEKWNEFPFFYHNIEIVDYKYKKEYDKNKYYLSERNIST